MIQFIVRIDALDSETKQPLAYKDYYLDALSWEHLIAGVRALGLLNNLTKISSITARAEY